MYKYIPLKTQYHEGEATLLHMKLQQTSAPIGALEV